MTTTGTPSHGSHPRNRVTMNPEFSIGECVLHMTSRGTHVFMNVPSLKHSSPLRHIEQGYFMSTCNPPSRSSELALVTMQSTTSLGVLSPKMSSLRHLLTSGILASMIQATNCLYHYPFCLFLAEAAGSLCCLSELSASTANAHHSAFIRQSPPTRPQHISSCKCYFGTKFQRPSSFRMSIASVTTHPAFHRARQPLHPQQRLHFGMRKS